MISPAIPINESTRIDTLRSFNILDTSPEERFDRLTRLAKRLFNVPIALVSLVDTDRQWFKSCVGLSVSETPRDISFCGHAILGDDVFMVSDTLTDERFYNNPLVTGGPTIRFYAGCPLTVPDGSKLGTLCLIDINPRILDDEERKLLQDLAHMVEQEIAAVQMATMDELTMLSNRRGFEALAQHALKTCHRMKKPVSLLFFDLNDFKKINDTYGHKEGDTVLVTFAGLLQKAFRECDVIGRLGGDEFVALLIDSNYATTSECIQRFNKMLDVYNSEAHRGYDIHCSVGQIECDVERHSSISCILSDADTAMYANKRALKALSERHEP